MKRKSQIWSLDSIIASVIFITSIVVFVVIVTNTSTKLTSSDIEKDSTRINQIVGSTGQGISNAKGGISNPGEKFSFLIGTNIYLNNFKNLQELSYTDLKTNIGIRSNFCIYFEDMGGNVINMSNYTGIGGIGLGHSGTKFKKNGNFINCSNQ